MEATTRFLFHRFSDYEDGKMARLEMMGEDEIPINLFADNAAEVQLTEGEPCYAVVCGIGSDIRVYPSGEAMEQERGMAKQSLIPMGTFPLDPDDENFEESPHILFGGIVLDAAFLRDAPENDANCCLLVETLGMNFELYFRYEGTIEPGNAVYGVAWLFGDLYPGEPPRE